MQTQMMDLSDEIEKIMKENLLVDGVVEVPVEDSDFDSSDGDEHADADYNELEHGHAGRAMASSKGSENSDDMLEALQKMEEDFEREEQLQQNEQAQ